MVFLWHVCVIHIGNTHEFKFCMLVFIESELFLLSDWFDGFAGELGCNKHPSHNWPTDSRHTCVERQLLHPQILFGCFLWLPTLVWVEQKKVFCKYLLFFLFHVDLSPKDVLYSSNLFSLYFLPLKLKVTWDSGGWSARLNEFDPLSF